MTFLIFIFGLIVGSFLNSVIHRLHTGQSIAKDSSRCPNCNHRLSSLDLIPVVSFFVLGRRCRYCKKPISWMYPLLELTTALAFVLVYAVNVTDYGKVLFQWFFTSFLIIIFVYDLKHYLILDKIIFPAAGLALIYQIWRGNFLSALLGAFILAGFFGLLYLVSKGRWIGFGDVKLGIFLGLLVPFSETLVLFFLAYFIGAITGIVLIAWGKKGLSDRLPFGTFLTSSAFFAMLWGEELAGWYFKLIGIR